jgi:uncharacterized protein YjdB
LQIAQLRARALSLWFCAGLVVLAIPACNKEAVNPVAENVGAIVVDPLTASVPVGSSVALTAEVRDTDGQVLASVRVSWTSEDSTIAQVSQSGIVTALRPGTVRIAASSWGKDAIATITVQAGPIVLPAVGRVVIAPTNARIEEGETIQLNASVLDAQDRVITGIPVTWSSSNTSRATVDHTGLVRGLSNGTVTISASAGGKTGSTTVRIDN